MRRPRVRISLLNLMIAMALLAITFAVTRPITVIRPTYIAVTWLLLTDTNHNWDTHAALSRDLTSDAVIRDIFNDPDLSERPQFQEIVDAPGKLRRNLLIRVHPRVQGYIDPAKELVWIAVESSSASEANLLKNAFVHAYLERHRWGRVITVTPVTPERSNPPVFDRPWKFGAAMSVGLSFCVVSLFLPLKRVGERTWRMLAAAAAVVLVVGGIVWWLLHHPEFSWRMGGIRVF